MSNRTRRFINWRKVGKYFDCHVGPIHFATFTTLVGENGRRPDFHQFGYVWRPLNRFFSYRLRKDDKP